jgi:hypothetical protein
MTPPKHAKKKINRTYLLIAFIVIALIAVAYTVWPRKPIIPNVILKLVPDSLLNKTPDTVITEKTIDENEICTTRKISWTPGQDETILYDPSESVIYPGNVLDPTSFENGKYISVGVGNRRPITISISVPGFGQVRSRIENPTLSTVREGISQILKSGMTGKQAGYATINCKEIFSKEHLTQLLKGKYSAGFGKIEASYDFKDTKIKTRYLVDITQIFYTLDVDPINKDSFFIKRPEDEFKVSPVYVSEVKYGRKILFTIESDQNHQNEEKKLELEFKAFSGSGSVTAGSSLEKINNENCIKGLFIGGDPGTGFESVNLRDSSLFDNLKKTAVWSLDNQGSALSYTLRHAATNSIFTVALSGEYTARMCEMKSDSVLTLKPEIPNPLCAAWAGSGDFEFNSHGPNIEFLSTLSCEKNEVYLSVRCVWAETQEDNTLGKYEGKIRIGLIPAGYRFINFKKNTIIQFNPPQVNTAGHGVNLHHYAPEDSYIENLDLVGDTQGDDVVRCRTRIDRLTLYPIEVLIRKIN